MRDRVVDGKLLRQIRLNLRMKQVDAAAAVGLRKEHLCRVESGHLQPSDLAALNLADLYQCDLDDFSVPKPGRDVA